MGRLFDSRSRRGMIVAAAMAASSGLVRVASADNTIANGGTLTLNGAPNTSGLAGQFYGVTPPNSNNIDPQFNANTFLGQQAYFNGSVPQTLTGTGSPTVNYSNLKDSGDFTNFGAPAAIISRPASPAISTPPPPVPTPWASAATTAP